MIKPKTFRPWTPGQTHLMPPSPIEWLPSDHLVFFLLDLPAELDFSAIMAPALAKDPRGEKGFDPRMMTLDQQQSSADLSRLSGIGLQPIPAMSRRSSKPLR